MDTRAFDQMDKEHRIISEMIEVFTQMLYQLEAGGEVSSQSLSEAIEFFRIYADGYHHGKEEELLFPAADKAGIVQRQGGPECTLFFGLYLKNSHLDKVKKDVKSYDLPITPYKPKECLKELIDKNSPLKIPLEEHEFGYYSMQLMTAELKKKHEDQTWNPHFFIKVGLRYVDMLYYHIRKEDDCLFQVLKKGFSSEELLQLSEQFEHFNQIHKEKEVRALEILKALKKTDL